MADDAPKPTGDGFPYPDENTPGNFAYKGPKTPPAADVSLPCFMAGSSEILTVEAIGRFGVSFKYNADASVIVVGDDLFQVRTVIDQQIAAWQAHHGRAPAGSLLRAALNGPAVMLRFQARELREKAALLLRTAEEKEAEAAKIEAGT